MNGAPRFAFDVDDALRARGAGPEELLADIARQHPVWAHTFEFTNGVSTPGRDPSARKLAALHLPERLDGLTVIDIGAHEGYFAFQAEVRGAARVVAADDHAWTKPEADHLGHFRFMHTLLRSNVEERIIRVEAVSPQTVGVFDVVLFMGVLYHAQDPLAYLERVRSVTRGVAVIETLVDMLHVDEPCARLYPSRALHNTPTNWWAPNIGCLGVMLERAGFARWEYVSLYETNTVERILGFPAEGRLRSGRAVVHAFA